MLETVNLDQRLEKPDYRTQLRPLQDRLHRLQRACSDAPVGTIVVFEGWDACGKGGIIRRLTRRLKPRTLRMHTTREPEWRRAYREINEFERQLDRTGVLVVKFWIHIGPEEQLTRFEARKDSPYKSWKLTDEDWRNRQKWAAYEEAVEEMLQRTSTAAAPWTIVEGNNKRFARVRAARHLADQLAAHLGEPEADAR
jgi:polyphosphate kinase 2 (PPK2 family)